MPRTANVSTSSRRHRCVRSVLATAIAGALLIGGVLPVAAQEQPGYEETGQSGNADSWRSDEFQADWGLDAIGAQHAYARGLTGRGVRLGILDSGVDLRHGEFGGRSHNGIRIADVLADGTLCADATVIAGPDACFVSDGDRVAIDYYRYSEDDRAFIQFLIDIGYLIPEAHEIIESYVGFEYSTHGTHVAGTMAANRDGNGTHGVAFGADLTTSRLFSDSVTDVLQLFGLGGDSYGIGPQEAALDSMYDQMAAQGVRAINHSWGLSVEPSTAAEMDDLYNAPGVADYLATFTDPSLRDQVIQVWSAGNDSGAIAGLYATLPRWTPEVEKYWLSVVNINRDGGIDGSSSICGLSANWCLAAPGTDITSSVVGGEIEGEVVYDADGNVVGIDVTSETPEYGHGDLTGTSMAAPHVTGALALLMERYPYLYNDQIRDVLLTTARDLGAAGVDEVYGWGLMDLEKAIEGYAQFRVDTNVEMNQRAGGAKVWEGLAWDDWTNDIGGPGHLTKSGIGWLRLSGDNSFAGATIAEGILELDGDNALSGDVEVDGGNLLLNGTLTDTNLVVTDGSALVQGSQNGGNTYVGAAGRLTGTGTLASTTIAGTVAPGMSIGALNINGDYTQLAGSYFEAALGLAGASDRLVVSGSADLQGGTLRFVQGGASSMLLGEQYNILSAASVLGQFGAIDSAAFSPFLAFDIGYGASQVTVDVVRGQLLASAARTFNQAAVAGAIDAAPMEHGITRVLTQLFPAQALPALDSLSGELHAGARSVLVDTQRHVRDTALARAQAGQGAFAASETAGASVWVDLARNGGALHSDGNAGRLDYSGNTSLLGAEYRSDAGWRIGALGGTGRSDMDVDGRGTDGDITGRHLGVYAGQTFGGFGVRAGVTHMKGEVEVRRIVDLAGLQDRTRAEYDARTTQAFVEGGYRFAAGAWEIEPYAQFAQVRVETDGFQEAGGGTALRGGEADDRVDLATAGVRFNVNLASAGQSESWLSLRGGLGYRDAGGDLVPAANVTWEDGLGFTVRGAPLADDATLLEVGLGARVGVNSLLELGYSGQLADESRDHAVNARLSVNF